jgi:hypothetical protein
LPFRKAGSSNLSLLISCPAFPRNRSSVTPSGIRGIGGPLLERRPAQDWPEGGGAPFPLGLWRLDQT